MSWNGMVKLGSWSITLLQVVWLAGQQVPGTLIAHDSQSYPSRAVHATVSNSFSTTKA
jgi:hypothetical protein